MKALNLSKQFALVTVAVLGAATFAVGAHADESTVGVDSRVVHFSDLNLNTAAGAKVLYQRIRSAAEQVCGDRYSRQMDQASAAKACQDKAIIAGIRSVNSAQLTRTASTHGYQVEMPINVASAR